MTLMSVLKASLFILSLCVVYSENNTICDDETKSNSRYKSYFSAMQSIYNNIDREATCLPVHQSCGWPEQKSDLPLYVIIVGLEGSGHHLWSSLLQIPVVECNWVNGRHYIRDINDGVPRRSGVSLASGLKEQFKIRKKAKGTLCSSIADTEDSFPVAALRKPGRMFMRPDLLNIQEVDGVLVNVKYIISVRNTTDTILSAMRRNFVSSLNQGLRIAEHTLTYLEAAMRGISCHKVFIASFEHLLASPSHYLEPLSDFLQLDSSHSKVKLLWKNLQKNAKDGDHKSIHDLTQYTECTGLSQAACHWKMHGIIDRFVDERKFMWPTFSAQKWTER